MQQPLDALAPNAKRIWSYAIDDLVISIFFIAIFFDQLRELVTPEAGAALKVYSPIVPVKIVATSTPAPDTYIFNTSAR